MLGCGTRTSVVVQFLEKCFYHWGRLVARRPWIVIIASLTMTILCSLSFINFDYPFRTDPNMKLITLNFVSDPNKIWIPKGSDYLNNKKWLSKHFPQNKRLQTLIFKAEGDNGNILSPDSLKAMLKVHQLLDTYRVKNTSFDEICER